MATENTQNNQNQSAQGQAAAEGAGKTQPKVVSLGKPILVPKEEAGLAGQVQAKSTKAADGNTGGQTGAEGSTDAATGAAGAGAAGSAAGADNSQASAGGSGSSQAAEPTEDQIKSFFEKQGIEWKGIDDAKAKLKGVKAEPTEEEKKQAILAKDKKRLDLYVARGGTIEEYSAIKSVSESNLEELSKKETKRDLIKAGFTEEQADDIIKSRYYLMSQEEIDLLDNDDDKALAKKKVEFFNGKLNTKASHLQDQAKRILESLDSDIDAENSQAEAEAKLSSKVDEHLKAMPREITFDLGKVDDKPIDPIKYTVSDAEINEVLDVLKDPDKRKKFLYTEDGSLNVSEIASALVYKAAAKNIAKAAALEGGSREVKRFEGVFPNRNAHEVGVGGAQNGKDSNGKTAGKLVSAGKPQVVR